MKQSRPDDFQYVWDTWITHIIQLVYKEVDEEFKNFTSMTILNMNEIQRKCSSTFKRLENELKEEFYGLHDNTREEKNLSMAKHAAIICKCLILHKPIRFDTTKIVTYREMKKIKSSDTKWYVNNELVNYRIAFFSCMSFLFHAMESTYKDLDALKMLGKLRKNRKIILYKLQDCMSGVHEDYDKHLIMHLARLDKRNKEFDFIFINTLWITRV